MTARLEMAKSLPFPRIYLLPTHLEPEELHYFEDAVSSLTYDIHEAELILGKISRPARAEFELRRRKLNIRLRPERDGQSTTASMAPGPVETLQELPSPKRRKLVDAQHSNYQTVENKTIQVLKLSWLIDCLAQREILPVENYLLLEGYKITPLIPNVAQHKGHDPSHAGKILERATMDTAPNMLTQVALSPSRYKVDPIVHSQGTPPPLVRETTSEHEVKPPGIPDFLHTTYSCQRPTPLNSPNDDFILELKKIRTLRILQGDQIGVRAYSTSIATIAAYPHLIKSSHEVERLPGCSTKIAELYQAWLRDGKTRETAAAESDARISTLKLFYDIWGVGDTTAREFYKKGWRDLDDLVEHGWRSLTRVQQIGVKFYEEFAQKISRPEVEGIANLILEHAQGIEPGFEMVIVGGYRRGKKESGDVDIILSHREESKTMHMIERLVVSLERFNLVTHTLSIWTKNSERGQLPLAWQGDGAGRGSGFDTLDKAMIVWQNKQHLGQKAPHRRVDIIISPWKTVGCALLGWSGGTTFQRDLRRYCKQEKQLKFDSSGIRSRTDGTWVDFESRFVPPVGETSPGQGFQLAPSMEVAEKRVFEGLGLTWRDPSERCTG